MDFRWYICGAPCDTLGYAVIVAVIACVEGPHQFNTGLYICLYQVAKYFVWLVVIMVVVGAKLFTSKQPQRRRQCLHDTGISWILVAPCFPFGSIVGRTLIKFSEMFSCSEKNRKRKTHHTETTECFLWCDILDSSSAFALMQGSISNKATAKVKRFLIIPLWKSINMT